MREESKAAGKLMRDTVQGEEKDIIAKMEASGVKVTADIAAYYFWYGVKDEESGFAGEWDGEMCKIVITRNCCEGLV